MNRTPVTRPRALARPFSVALALAAGLAFGPAARRSVAEAPPPAADAFEVVESSGSYRSQGKAVSVERYEPKAPGRYPAVLVVHGAGGMTVGGPWFRGAARHLARRGYVAQVVHYFDLTGTRVADRPTMKAHFPAWMKAIADGITDVSARPNVEPGRVGLVGFSLGSYLSLSLATFDPRVLAVVDYYGGLPDVLAPGVKSLPPTLILHGEADPIVPVGEARELEALCRAKGVPHEVRIYPGQGHGFFGEPGADALRRAAGFLDAHVRKADLSRKRPTAALPEPGDYARLVDAAD